MSEVSEKFETYFKLQLKSLSKMTKEDLDAINTRLDRMADKPEELVSVLARKKVRSKIDDFKERAKARVSNWIDERLG